jgi:hypothetical protein
MYPAAFSCLFVVDGVEAPCPFLSTLLGDNQLGGAT